MKTQHSQKLQINKYHLKDNNNKINHHSRERDLFLSPLEMFAFCVTEKASGSCPGVSFSWFWTQELHVCLLSGLCATGHVFFPCWVWLNTRWNLPGGHVCAEGLGPQEQASGDLCLFKGRTETRVAQPLPCCVSLNKSGPSLVSSPHCSHQLWIPKPLGTGRRGESLKRWPLEK